MNNKKWILGPALVAMLAASMGISHAQPGALGATAANPANHAFKAAKTGKGQREKKAQIITPANLVKILGAPLTPDQKSAVADAVKAYNEALAKAVGLTTDELNEKAKAYRAAQKGNKGVAPAAATAAAPAPAPAG